MLHGWFITLAVKPNVASAGALRDNAFHSVCSFVCPSVRMSVRWMDGWMDGWIDR